MDEASAGIGMARKCRREEHRCSHVRDASSFCRSLQTSHLLSTTTSRYFLRVAALITDISYIITSYIHYNG
jgi:two-component SAPR family response regulator